MLSYEKLTVLAGGLALALAAAPAAAQSTPQPGTGPEGRWDAEGVQKLEQLHAFNQSKLKIGQVAQKRAHAQAVKDLANAVVRDHDQIDRKLQDLAKKRNLNLGKVGYQSQIDADLQKDTQALEAQSGDAFDRLYVQHEIDTHVNMENGLKDLRDRTPGSDAELKSWLDTVEDKEEAHLAQARQAKVALDSQNRQARTPGK
jgi:predicted outer membrane protein